MRQLADARIEILKLLEIGYQRLKKVKDMKTKYPQTVEFQESVEALFGKERCDELKKQAESEVKILRAMQNFITTSLEDYMQEHQVGFNQLVRRLDVSPTYFSKMRKGQANLTITSFARLMANLGKEPQDILKSKK